MKKKSFLPVFIVALLVSVLSLLYACDEIREVIGIQVNGAELNTYQVGEFNYSDYTVTVCYDDGNSREIPLSEEMIPSAERIKFYAEGEQQIKVTYSNMEGVIKAKFVRGTFTNISLPSASFVYDGTSHGLTVQGDLPSKTQIIFTSGNNFVNVGTYDVNCDILCDGYEKSTLSSKLTITKADYDLSAIAWTDSSNYVYTGKEYAVELSGLPEGVTVDYSENKKTDAGNYLASVVCYYDEANYNKPIIPSYAWSIAQAEYDMGGVKFEDVSVEYDGEEHTALLDEKSILPQGVSVSYYNNIQTNAGVYSVRADFSGDEVNYKKIPSMIRTLTIDKKTVEIGDIEYDDQVFTYDGKAHLTEINPLTYSPDYTVEYIVRKNGEVIQEAVDAGEYTVEAKFIYLKDSVERNNFLADDSLFAKLTIQKATIARSNFSFDTTKFIYDGSDHKVRLTEESLAYMPLFGVQKGEGGEDIPFIKEVTYKYSSDNRSIESAINVGEYNVTAIPVINNVYEHNFVTPSGITSSYTIYKKSMTDYLAEQDKEISVDYGSNLVYDETEKTLTIQNLFEGITAKCNINDVTVSPKEPGKATYSVGTNAGEYKYSISFTFDDTLGNYENDLSALSGVISIAKKPLEANLTWEGDDYFTSAETVESPYSIDTFCCGMYRNKTVKKLDGYAVTLKINGKAVTAQKDGSNNLVFPIGINAGVYQCDFAIHLDDNHTDYELTRFYQITKGDFDLADYITYDDAAKIGEQRYVRISDSGIFDYVTVKVEVNGIEVKRTNNAYLIGLNTGAYAITYTVNKTSLGELNIDNITAEGYNYNIEQRKIADSITVYSENSAYGERDGSILVKGVPSGVSVFYKIDGGTKMLASVVGGETTIEIESKDKTLGTILDYEISFDFTENIKSFYSDTDKTYTGSIKVCYTIDPSDKAVFQCSYGTYTTKVIEYGVTVEKQVPVFLVTTSYPITQSDMYYMKAFDFKTEGGNTTFKIKINNNNVNGDIVTIKFGVDSGINFYQESGFAFVECTLKYNKATGEYTWEK